MAKSKLTAQQRDDLIALICKAATERFIGDRSRPGVHTAHIPATSESTAFWYVALHRYPRGKGADHRPGDGLVPLVVCKAKNDDLDEAYLELARFFAPPPTAAQDELRALLARSVK